MNDEQPPSVEQGRTIFDGFDAYLDATGEDYRDLFNTGTIVLDTSAILNLYRYSDQPRRDFLKALNEVRSRLWIPHQVMKEFWRNRGGAITEPTASPAEFTKRLRSATGAPELEDSFNKWSSRIGLNSETRRTMWEKWIASVEKYIEEVVKYAPETQREFVNTSKDTVLPLIAALLKGSIADPVEEGQLAKDTSDAADRIRREAPPGYRDQGKSEEKMIGDCLIWLEILRKSSSSPGRILFITSDVKEDWWRIESSMRRGPRVELYEEMFAVSGSKFYLLTPDSFLAHAKSILPIDVDSTSIDAIRPYDSRELYDEYRLENDEEMLFRYADYLREKGFRIIPTRLDPSEGLPGFIAMREAVGLSVIGASGNSAGDNLDAAMQQVYFNSSRLQKSQNLVASAEVVVVPKDAPVHVMAKILSHGMIPVIANGGNWDSTTAGYQLEIADRADIAQ